MGREIEEIMKQGGTTDKASLFVLDRTIFCQGLFVFDRKRKRGRNFAEYKSMFCLDENDMSKRIAGFGDGPACLIMKQQIKEVMSYLSTQYTNFQKRK